MFGQLQSKEVYVRGPPELSPEYVPPMNNEAAHDILYRANAVLNSSRNQLDDIRRDTSRRSKYRISRESIEDYLEGSVTDSISDRNERFFKFAELLASPAPLPSPSGNVKIDEAELMITPLFLP